MAENKTQPSSTSVSDFIDQVENEQKRNDAKTLLILFEKITGEKGMMWGPSIIGFGRYHYKYDSGREGDSMLAGFSPRKSALSLYIMAGFSKYDGYLSKLGKFKTGKSCLYIKKLADVDIVILEAMIIDSIKTIQAKYP
ncbi:MAG: hypothetical protein ACI8ZM_002910 [Crocinitomix sp.]|jgi:hypothetical protein